jgi:hypothetical protein
MCPYLTWPDLFWREEDGACQESGAERGVGFLGTYLLYLIWLIWLGRTLLSG